MSPFRQTKIILFSVGESKIIEKEVLTIFKRLDLPVKVIKKKGDFFYEVVVPSRRSDLNTSEDLIEEIGRLYGYENIPAEMPASVLIPAIKNEELINEEKARNIMVGAGFAEAYNYSLVSEKDKRKKKKERTSCADEHKKR